MKILILILCILPSVAFATCPTGDTCIDNGTITVGINPDHGGQITYFALSSDGINVFDSAAIDNGFGGAGAIGTWGYADHSLFGQIPGYTEADYVGRNHVYWNLNDTSCSSSLTNSDSTNTPVISMSVSGNSAYVKSMPLDWNWSDQYYNSDVSFPDPPYISNTEYAAKQGYLENWYTLSGNILHVKSQYTYIDSFDHSGISVDPSILTDTTNPDYIGPYNSSVTFAGGFQAGCWGVWDQNTSIVTTPDFSTMYTYGGNSPWTGGTLSSVLLSSDNQVQNNGAENWIALVNQTNGKGVGIYSPQNAVANALDIAGGHMCLGGVGGSTVNGGIWGTTANIGLGWNFTPAGSAQTSVSGPVMTVDSYYTIGTISDIRSAIYSIHAGLSQSPGVQAQVAQSARIRMK